MYREAGEGAEGEDDHVEAEPGCFLPGRVADDSGFEVCGDVDVIDVVAEKLVVGGVVLLENFRQRHDHDHVNGDGDEAVVDGRGEDEHVRRLVNEAQRHRVDVGTDGAAEGDGGDEGVAREIGEGELGQNYSVRIVLGSRVCAEEFLDGGVGKDDGLLAAAVDGGVCNARGDHYKKSCSLRQLNRAGCGGALQ